MNIKQIEKTLHLQHDASDCGVACLLSVIRFHGGNNSLENLRRLSGTSKVGTTLLGLYQCAAKLGFDASGAEGTVEELEKQEEPVILHVELENHLLHYMVFYGISNGEYILGDPAQGVARYDRKKLEKYWKSKKCLLLTPNTSFVKQARTKTEKRKWFLKLLKPDKQVLQFSVFVGVVVAILSMTLSVFSQKLVDDILPSKEIVKLVGGLGLLTLILLVRVGLSGLREYFLIYQTRAFNVRIIDSFYSALLRLPKPFFDTRKIGELVARLNDTSRIQGVIRTVVGGAIIDALVTVISFGFLFFYHWQTALIALLISPLYFILIYRFNRKIIDAQRNIMKAYALNESNYISTMQGITAIKNCSQESFFKRVNQQIYGAFQNEGFKLGQLYIRLSIFSGIVGVLLFVAIISYSSYHVIQDQLALGVLFAIIGIVGTLLPSVTSLALLSIPINEAKIAFDRMFEFASTKQESKKGEKLKTIDSISIENAMFRFAGRKPLFSDVSMTIKKGEILGIIGESGCGKTTLGALLQKHYFLDSGQILINDSVSLSEIKTSAWRKMVGVVEQTPSIFNGTLVDNITMGRQVHPEKMESFLKKYGFDSLFIQFPGGYATPLGEEGINISGGQRQLIALARALLQKPKVLILDEATSSLDKQTESFVLTLLKRLSRKSIIIFISHREQSLSKITNKIYRFM